jgi:hypothetical protein
MDIADDLPMHTWLNLTDAERWEVVQSYLGPIAHGREFYGRCKQGHAMTPENTYIRSNNLRSCLRCIRERERIRNAS